MPGTFAAEGCIRACTPASRPFQLPPCAGDSAGNAGVDPAGCIGPVESLAKVTTSLIIQCPQAGHCQQQPRESHSVSEICSLAMLTWISRGNLRLVPAVTWRYIPSVLQVKALAGEHPHHHVQPLPQGCGTAYPPGVPITTHTVGLDQQAHTAWPTWDLQLGEGTHHTAGPGSH
jgi:hypothetical protein